jgi:hypothetical protein
MLLLSANMARRHAGTASEQQHLYSVRRARGALAEAQAARERSGAARGTERRARRGVWRTHRSAARDGS